MQLYGKPRASWPAPQIAQHPLGISLVADDVVVDNEDRTVPAEVIEGLELAGHLLRGLGAWLAPVERDEVAELAEKRATTALLHGHLGVGTRVQQVVARHRLRATSGFALRAEDSSLSAGGHCVEPSGIVISSSSSIRILTPKTPNSP